MHTSIKSALAMAILAVGLNANAFELNNDNVVIKQDTTPNKIATYDLAVLDSLNAIDVDVVGVPKSMYEGDLSKFADTTVIGTLFEPDYDVLQKLAPDLIFAGSRSAKAIPDLEKLAPTAIYNIDPNHFIESFTKANLDLATAFDKTEPAQQIIDQINKNLAATQAANQGKTMAFLFIINDNIIAHVPGDRFGFAYDITGFDSVLPARPADYVAPPRPEPGSAEAKAAQEQRVQTIKSIAEADPDWLFILDRGAINGAEKTAEKTLAKHELLSQTSAFKNGNVYYVEPNPWYVITGGLNNFENITADLVKTFVK